MLRRLTDALYKAAVALSALALAVMVVVVAYQILGRYVPFLTRALWTEEIARMCLIWLVWLGAAVGVRTSEHFLIDLIPKSIGDRAQRVIITLGLALVTVIAVVLFIGSLSFVDTGAGRTSTTSGMSLVYSFTAPLVSSILMVLFSIEIWWEGMRRPDKGGLRLDQEALVEPTTGESPHTNEGTNGGEAR